MITNESYTIRAGRNIEIEALRFAAAIAVCGFHSGFLVGGWLAVDFFFILSGLLMTKSLVFSSSQTNKTLFCYQLKQIKEFYPELLISSLFCFSFTLFLTPSLYSLISKFVYIICNDLLLLRMSGLTSVWRGGMLTTWYLSSLILASAIAYPLIVRVKNPISLLCCACLPLGYYIHHAGGIQTTFSWLGITYDANFRALGDLLIGAAACHMAEFIKGTKGWLNNILLRRCIKIICFIWIMTLFMFRNPNIESLILVFSSVYLILAFSDSPKPQSNALISKVCLLLGKLSVSLYLSHGAVVYFLSPVIHKNSFLVHHHLNQVLVISLITLLMVVTYCGSQFIRKHLLRS